VTKVLIIEDDNVIADGMAGTWPPVASIRSWSAAASWA
jgi:hypothetical protein